MKKGICAFQIILIAILICTVPIFAVPERASEYISSHGLGVLPAGNGKMGIEFSVAGTGRMNAIGLESIIIYRASGDSWIKVAEFDRNDTNMIATNSGFHGGTKFYQGIPGEEYKVTITIFAENDSGYDSRTENFILTV